MARSRSGCDFESRPESCFRRNGRSSKRTSPRDDHRLEVLCPGGVTTRWIETFPQVIQPEPGKLQVRFFEAQRLEPALLADFMQ